MSTWSDYMREHGKEEYAAWEAAVKPYTEKIAALTQQLADLTADRDSEWRDSEAARNSLSDKLMASNRRCAEAEKERDAAQRWETGFRNIVTILIGPRTEFEIPEIVERVRFLANNAKVHEDVLDTADLMQKDRDSALALARQAVGVLEALRMPIHEGLADALLVWIQLPAGGMLKQITVLDLRHIQAFLARPEVVKIGGGK